MSTLNLGKVRVTFEGDWDSSNEYEMLSIVKNNYGIKYISLKDVPVDTDISDTEYWETITGDFVELYQGSHSSDPSKRNDGNDLQTGDLYFNSGNDTLKIYDGNSWKDVNEGNNAGINKAFASDDSDVEADKWYFVDTSSKSITLTLPSDPDNYDTLRVSDRTNNAQNNAVTIDRNGNKINDSDDDLTCDVNGFYVTLTYDSDTGSWYVINQN